MGSSYHSVFNYGALTPCISSGANEDAEKSPRFSPSAERNC